MPKKISQSAEQQGGKQSSSGSKAADVNEGSRSKDDKLQGAGSASKGSSSPAAQNSQGNQAAPPGTIWLHKTHPDERFFVHINELYPDIGVILMSCGQMNKCREAAFKLSNSDEKMAKAEYRKQYMSLMQADRATLKARADSGDRQAVKQWDEFCTATIKLMYMRQILYNKNMMFEPAIVEASQRRYTHPDSQPQALSDEELKRFDMTEKEIRELGKVVYALDREVAGSREGIDVVLLESDKLGDIPLILDMSNWVRNGAYHPVSNDLVQKWMAMMKKHTATDVKEAESIYQIFLDEVKDVNADQLADQAETGISKNALNMYMLFVDQCLQLAVLWQILYNKPITITFNFGRIRKRPLLGELIKQYRAANK